MKIVNIDSLWMYGIFLDSEDCALLSTLYTWYSSNNRLCMNVIGPIINNVIFVA